ncbi:MAG: pyridine nucleotide-disulfide oxidoreductase, partial [Planctomycetia bacterium]|nr:pyridine nucleotide-disulfide oxidoreductase [Planctomycetia bacterium]
MLGALLGTTGNATSAATVLVEAESFADHGGWSLDTQFIRQMGSPYLLAHGLGTPVADATTKVAFREAGTYH